MTAPMSSQPSPGGLSGYPQLRAEPQQPDGLDSARLELVHSRWNAQNEVRLPFERQVEEHCRLLAGRQWDTWNDTLGRFVDVTTLFDEDEKLWRQRPVVNYLHYWFLLTHARLTENPPIITFQPATSDRKDAMLAQTLDTVYKTVWADAHMSEAMDDLMRWVVAAGQGFLKSYPDATKGQESPRVGPASITLPHPETGEPMEMDLDTKVPLDKDGTPQFEVQQSEDGDLHAVPTADVEYEKDGQVCVAVLNPLQVRGEWNTKPWHEKAWHIHRDYYPVSEVEGHWGVHVTADTSQGSPESGTTPGYLERLLFGAGHYGTTERGGNALSSADTGVRATSATDPGFVRVDEYWEKPSQVNGMQGRHLVVTEHVVLYDGPNPFPKLRGPSPIRCFQFVGLPGRPAGTTPMEFLVPLQRQMNRFWAQAMEHASLMTNPMLLTDESAGLEDEQFTMMPGATIQGGLRNGQPMVAALTPPTLSADFWKIQEMVRDTLMFLGNITGTEGTAPTDNASGELVSQLRANSDRFVGPTARQMVTEIARMAEDWTAILSVLWTRPKLLLTAGEDNVPQTVAVEPEMWDGNANAVPDVQSMLPESREAKQQRIMGGFTAGIFGNPADPSVAENVRGMLQFPNMNRAMQPGGVDAITANQALGKVLLGTPAAEIPLFEPYKLPIWLDTVGKYIASPEYLANDPQVQQEVMGLWQKIKMTAAQQMIQQAGEASAVQAGQMEESAKNNPMAALELQQHATAMQTPPGGPDHPGPATPTDVGGPKKDAPPPPLAA
jgi:hypothetical protein